MADDRLIYFRLISPACIPSSYQPYNGTEKGTKRFTIMHGTKLFSGKAVIKEHLFLMRKCFDKIWRNEFFYSLNLFNL